MRKFPALLVLISISLFTACQAPAPEAGPLSEEDVAGIRRSIDSIVQTAIANDWAAWAAVHTQDAVRLPPNQPIVEGRPAIQDWGAAFTVVDFTVTPVEIEGRDGVAYERSTYSITFTREGLPEPVTQAGKSVHIWNKQPDGTWLMAIGIWNTDLPLLEQEAVADESQVE
jgi:ketosteroid isomerase-like protein